jgi:hypothetical protein
MEMREFGGTGIRASVVGLVCNNFGIYQNAAQAVAVVDLNTSQAIAAANGLTSFATMGANCSILVRDAEKATIQ